MNAIRKLPAWEHIVSRLASSLNGVPAQTMDLFDALFSSDPPIHSARDLAERYGLSFSTLHSRFFRASLATPKVLVVEALLVRVCFLLDDPYVSGTEVSDELQFSSPQSMSRTIGLRTGMTVTQLRRVWPGEERLDLFVSRYVTAQHDKLVTANLVGRRRYLPVIAYGHEISRLDTSNQVQCLKCLQRAATGRALLGLPCVPKESAP